MPELIINLSLIISVTFNKKETKIASFFNIFYE